MVLSEFGQNLVIQAHLIATNGTPVRWIERKNHGPAAEFSQRKSLVGCDIERKLWRGRPRLQHLGHGFSFAVDLQFSI